ncbi:ATP synthase F1 subunit delta [Paraflavisolibacter sp. H34]|uniref:ATP synthase F1 subunit delta n=1 Tax=Huijunlia imazamoxiresistens TaxID=3127457 RepID=UPI0030196CC1
MLNPRLAARYAKSLIDLAQEQGQLEKVYADMVLLQNITRSNREFLNFLRSPIISADKKEKILTAVMGTKVGPLTAAFAKLLVNKSRESALPEIITAFIQQYKDIKGIRTVKLTTAAPISEAVKNAIVEQVKKAGNIKNLDLETSVNEKLIGGFVLQTGDKMVDVSIAHDLKEIERQFQNNDFIYNIR